MVERVNECTADPRSVANHEASHAVVWWWWVNRPDGEDDGSHGDFDDLSLSLDGRVQKGSFRPGVYVHTAEMPAVVDHNCVGLFAGPVSDDMRGETRCFHTTDEQLAEKFYFDGIGREMDEAERERLRGMARGFLEHPEVVAMVEALEDALVERGRLTYLEAIAVMESARKDLNIDP